jgi:hypothetical protein
MVAARSRCVVDVEAEGRLRHDLCGVQRRREVGRDRTRRIDRGGCGVRGADARGRRANSRPHRQKYDQVFVSTLFFVSTAKKCEEEKKIGT